MRSLRLFALLTAGLFAFACGHDMQWPSLDKVEVLQGTTAVTSVDISAAGATTIEDDVPVDATFALHFTEPVDLTSAKKKIRIKDAGGTELTGMTISARLEVVNLALAAPMAAGQNHVLEVDSGIKDTSGNPSAGSVKVNFYTAP